MFSGLPLIADMGADIVFVRVVPFATNLITCAAAIGVLIDYLVGGEQ